MDPRCVSLVRIGVKRLGINLPPATDTDQRQVVGEVTRWHGAVDDRERRIGTGFVDRENLIMAGQAPFGRRLAPADNLKILLARPISNGLTVRRIKMRIRMEDAPELLKIAIM